MQHLDKETILDLSGVVFECRELGDLEAEVVVLPDGRFEVISKSSLTWLPSMAYKYRYGIGEDCGQEVINYLEKISLFLPVLDRICRRVSKISIPGDGEMKVIPILKLLV